MKKFICKYSSIIVNIHIRKEMWMITFLINKCMKRHLSRFFFNAAVLACAETASATKMQAGQSFSYRCLSVIGR